MQEMQVRSTGQEDSLEKEMATHSNILVWKIPRPEETGRLQSMGWQKESDRTWQLNNNKPNLHLIELVKEEQTKPHTGRRKDIIKIRTEISKTDTKKTI